MPQSQKADGFRFALSLAYATYGLNPINIVETGTIRAGSLYSDGGSTRYWSQWIRPTNSSVYTIDIEEKNLEICKNQIGTHANLHFVLGDSKEFLRDFSKPIHILFLDSMDCAPPITSTWEHQLLEVEIALPKLHKDALILLDDFNGFDRIIESKSYYSLPLLLSKGFRVVSEAGHQILLTR